MACKVYERDGYNEAEHALTVLQNCTARTVRGESKVVYFPKFTEVVHVKASAFLHPASLTWSRKK
jgi:hypothetical protein